MSRPARTLLHWGRAAADFVFPRLCCGCGERVLAPGALICPDCLRSLPELRLPLCPTCGLPEARLSGGRCDDCPRGTISFEAARAVTPFLGLATTIVEKLKYNGRLEYAGFMAERMAEVVSKEFAGVTFTALIPVPLHRTRHRERGFNQSEELARRLEPQLGVPVQTGVVHRVRATPSQTRLNRRARADNVRGAFAVPAGTVLTGQSLLLIDDVYTTGATLNECARVLREAGATSIHCTAFARALR